MGFGDELMATGMARGAKARGKRIAFGNGRQIIWGPWSKSMFRHNPNIARPGDEGASDLEWVEHYKGHRLYNRVRGNRWVWNMQFRAQPGELFFSDDELGFAERAGDGFVLIEPNVPLQKSVAVNKDWGVQKYQAVVERLSHDGQRVVQFDYGRNRLSGVDILPVPDFRHALAIEARAALYIGPEGGLHHGAAAVGIHAVVLFGGFIPPAVTGYETHTNLTGGVAVACGSFNRCEHCRAAMSAISVDEVHEAACSYLRRGCGDRSSAKTMLQGSGPV